MPLSHFRPLLEKILATTEPAVLATLVEVQGSSYRRPGTRMLMPAKGEPQGIISAGCLEQDLSERMAAVLESDRPSLVRYDMGTDLDLIWGTGMGCQGQAAILLMPVCHKHNPLVWAERALQALEERRPGVLLTCYASDTPARVGAMTWWDPTQPHPHLHPDTLEVARRALASRRPESLRLGEDVILAEPVIPPPALWIIGAGEPTRPLAALATVLGWEVGILDHRPALATEARFPGARRVIVDAPEQLSSHIHSTEGTAVVVMSHVFEVDKAALRQLMSKPLPYLGLQGNRRRTEKLLRTLAEEGFVADGDALARLRAPMGLDLGAETPEAIALSTMAEIHAVLHGRSGMPLSGGIGPIHP